MGAKNQEPAWGLYLNLSNLVMWLSGYGLMSKTFSQSWPMAPGFICTVAPYFVQNSLDSFSFFVTYGSRHIDPRSVDPCLYLAYVQKSHTSIATFKKFAPVPFVGSSRHPKNTVSALWCEHSRDWSLLKPRCIREYEKGRQYVVVMEKERMSKVYA